MCRKLPLGMSGRFFLCLRDTRCKVVMGHNSVEVAWGFFPQWVVVVWEQEAFCMHSYP